MKNLSCILLIYFIGVFSSHAQEDIFGIDTKARSRKSSSEVGNVFRNAISNISFELSGGANYHVNKLDFLSEFPSQYPVSQYADLENPLEITSADSIGFGGNNYAYPFNAGIRISLFDLITIGGGYGREFGQMSNLMKDPFEFSFENTSYTFDKLYGTVGLVLYDAKKRAGFLNWRYKKYSSQNFYMQSEKNQRIRQRYPWKFIAEGEFGNMKIQQSYDNRLMTNNEPYYGISLRVERELSEYTRLFVKTGAEFRNFAYQIEDLLEAQNIDQTLYGVQLGFSIRLPGTKRCKVQGCGVVMKHLHEGVEYRGSSIFNFQNRKIGQWY